MELLDDTLVKAQLDDIVARIDGILKKVEKFEADFVAVLPRSGRESVSVVGEPEAD
jgi:hypothetical protein